MTDEEINIHLAEICGWREINKIDYLHGVHPEVWSEELESKGVQQTIWMIPDCANNHDATYRTEKHIGLHDRNNLDLRVKWVGILRDLVAPFCPLNKVGSPVISDLDILTADAKIKAMALVKLTQKKKKK
jgi:hypothetical protein